AGGGLHAGQAAHVRMAFERTAELAQGLQLFLREVTGLGEDGVQQRGGVALAQDEAIALRRGGVLRIMAEEPTKVEANGDLDRRQRAGRMAGTGRGRAGDDASSNGP